jgi:prevent-host-death family protein
MKTVTAKELKNRTGDVIRSVKKGEEVLLSYRGKALGKFVPLQEASILSELSGILKDAPRDMKQVRDKRLKEKHEGLY